MRVVGHRALLIVVAAETLEAELIRQGLKRETCCVLCELLAKRAHGPDTSTMLGPRPNKKLSK